MNHEQLRKRCFELFTLDEGRGVIYWKNAVKWKKAGSVAGCIDSRGYWRVSIENRGWLVHRLVFLMVHGWMPIEVDHVNGIRSDNRIENLRAATRAQNSWNSCAPANNSSGVKGVCWTRSKKRWHAYIMVNGNNVYLGRFAEFSDAVAARKDAEKKYHGQFARIA